MEPLGACLYRFRWVSESGGRLPGFLGPAIRGGLGRVLRRLVCSTGLRDCGQCLLRHGCAYPALFQPFAAEDSGEGRRYRRMPVPFVLRVPFGPSSPRDLRPGQPLEFEMVLVGRANAGLPYYVLAMSELGRAGLGASAHRFCLEKVEAWTPEGFVRVYEAGSSVVRTDVPVFPLSALVQRFVVLHPGVLAVRFVTPVRLDLGGDLVYPVGFAHLVRGLVQRWRALAACYGGLVEPDFPLDEAERAATVRDRTRWVDLKRYSSRQRAEMRIGGAVGTVVYEGADFQVFGPLLAFGEWLGVGKLTSMGLGRIEVVYG